jgi:hypothetical protein
MTLPLRLGYLRRASLMLMGKQAHAGAHAGQRGSAAVEELAAAITFVGEL